jgi:hypothetical protein
MTGAGSGNAGRSAPKKSEPVQLQGHNWPLR